MQPAVALDGVQVIGETALRAVAKLRLITKGQIKCEVEGKGKGARTTKKTSRQEFAAL